MKQDGSEAQKILADPILDIDDVSPNGQWLIRTERLWPSASPIIVQALA
jgi:hypothetical protein